jgi:serine/threonine-protein kinase
LTDDADVDATAWYVRRGDKKFGPYSLARLREFIEQKRVTPTDQVTRMGTCSWVQAGSLRSLFPPEAMPTPRPRMTMGDSDELVLFDDPRCAPAAAPLATAGIQVRPNPTFTLGDFQILHKLGAGGMGAVYLAWQRSLGRQVALKVLAKKLTAQKTYVDRFYREANVLSGLVHPNIIRFYGVGEERDFPYFAMEYVEGISAAAALRRFGGRLAVADALHIVLQCARGMGYAHAHQVVHRDVKPENIMITRLGHVKITDLGLAKPLTQDMSLTKTGTVLGTPKYMAPEQALNAKNADQRSDLYALGGVLYHFLTGEAPFQAETLADLQAEKQAGLSRPARRLNPDVPPRLDLLTSKMLLCDPRARYQNAAQLIRDIESLGLAGHHLSFNPLRAFVPGPGDPAPGDHVEILLIDDRTFDIILAQEALEENGLPSNLNAVEDDREALAFLRQEGKYSRAPRPALILLGRNLRAGGLDVLAALRANDAWRSIPVVLLADDAQTTELLTAHGLQVSLSVARPDGKREFTELVQSLKNLYETIVDPSRV